MTSANNANREWALKMAQQLEELFIVPTFETQRGALESDKPGLLYSDDVARDIAEVVRICAGLRAMSEKPTSLNEMLFGHTISANTTPLADA